PAAGPAAKPSLRKDLMPRHTRCRPGLLAPLVLALLLAGCATEKALQDGQALLAQGRYVAGLALLNRAAEQSPGEPRYRARVVLEQERAIATLLAQAERQRQAGEIEAASATYARVLRLSPGNTRA